jgi:hypothetical protein
MGYGDEIMAAGQVRVLQHHSPARTAIVDRVGRPRWHALWQGNRLIATPAEAAADPQLPRLVNGPGCRPYIDYARSTEEHWAYTSWRCAPGELQVARREPQGYVVVEPHVKRNASPNKQWGWARWQSLAESLRDLDLVQLGARGVPALAGVRRLETGSFLEACSLLGGARAAVLPEGGLHHAAAALDVPAVVIFGSMVSPENMGYDGHDNIYRPHGSGPCGARIPCPACAAVMASIGVGEVARRLRRLVGDHAGAR